MSNSKFKVLGIGNILVDVCVTSSTAFSVDDFLKKNDFKKGSYSSVSFSQANSLLQKIDSATVTLQHGGAVANSLFYLSNHGTSSALIGSLGNDAYADFFKKKAAESNLSLLLNPTSTTDTKTGFCIAFVSSDGERTMRTFLGNSPELFAPIEDIPICEDFFIESFLWEKEENISLSISWINQILKKSTNTTINLCAGNIPVFSLHKKQIFFLAKNKLIHRIFLNKQEAFCLTATSSIQEVASVLMQYFSLSVVTDGKNGSWLITRDNFQHIPAIQIKIDNSTGAGDIYAGAFIQHMQLKKDPPACAKFASQTVAALLG